MDIHDGVDGLALVNLSGIVVTVCVHCEHACQRVDVSSPAPSPPSPQTRIARDVPRGSAAAVSSAAATLSIARVCYLVCVLEIQVWDQAQANKGEQGGW